MNAIRAPKPRRGHTWEREAFSSFNQRWAEALNVSVTFLLSRLVCPEIDVPVAAYGYGARPPKLDACSRSVVPWMEATERLTRNKSLSHLAVWGMRDLISTQCRLRRSYAWCPYCLEEFAAEQPAPPESGDQMAFSPLIWRVREYCVCIRHEVPMVRQCPHCGYDQLRIIWNGARPGCCSKCRRWMGKSYCETNEDVALDKLAASVCVADIFALPWCSQPVRDNFQSFFADVKETGIASPPLLAKVMGVEKQSVSSACTARRKPSIRELINLSEATGMGIVDLLGRRPVPEGLAQRLEKALERGGGGDTIDRRRSEIHKRIRSVIRSSQSIDGMPSVRSVCRRLDLGFNTVRNAEPELVAEVVARRRDASKGKTSYFQRLVEAMDRVILRGGFPSAKALAAEDNISMLNPALRRQYTEERARRGLPMNIRRNGEACRKALDAEIERIRTRKKAV